MAQSKMRLVGTFGAILLISCAALAGGNGAKAKNAQLSIAPAGGQLTQAERIDEACASGWKALEKMRKSKDYDRAAYGPYCASRLASALAQCAEGSSESRARCEEKTLRLVVSGKIDSLRKPTDGHSYVTSLGDGGTSLAGEEIGKKAREACDNGWLSVLRRGGGGQFDHARYQENCYQRVSRLADGCAQSTLDKSEFEACVIEGSQSTAEAVLLESRY